MGTIIMFLGGLIALVALLGPGAEGWARLVAAGLFVLHPIHEQKKGFRRLFNARVRGYTMDITPEQAKEFRVLDSPLSHRMNRIQAIALTTVFPALTLFGPWWALAGIGAFYSGDYSWTHGIKKVPGFSSAVAAFLATCWALWLARPEPPPSPAVALGAIAAGLLVLALPWIMAYRRVRS